MLEVVKQDYVRTARAKGLSRWKVTMRHTFRNALIPIVTVAGSDLSTIFTGSMTPLMYAAQKTTEPAVISMLIDLGADAKATDKNGKNALAYAKENEAVSKTDAYRRLSDLSY